MRGSLHQSLDVKWWRSQLGWVPQDVQLFNRTVAENIVFGCQGPVEQEQIIAAATAANAHSFIEGLPQVCSLSSLSHTHTHSSFLPGLCHSGWVQRESAVRRPETEDCHSPGSGEEPQDPAPG